MAHYLVYIPGAEGADPAQLDRVGLEGLQRGCAQLTEDRIDDTPQAFPILNDGPDGGAGVIFSWLDPRAPDKNPRAGHFADSQTWTPAPPDPVRKLPAKRYWLGIETARPPRPDDLARRHQLHGLEILLAGDEDLPREQRQGWRIPSALTLPARYVLDPETGEECQEVKSPYRDLWDRSRWFWDVAENYVRHDIPFDRKQLREYIACFLSQNYRVNLPLCYALKLFDGVTEWNAALATVDFSRLQDIEAEVQKKSSPLTPCT